VSQNLKVTERIVTKQKTVTQHKIIKCMITKQFCASKHIVTKPTITSNNFFFSLIRLFNFFIVGGHEQLLCTIHRHIALLTTLTPIDETIAADDALLDYDSDDGTAQNTLAILSDPASSAMDVENGNQTDSVAGPSNISSSTVQDAMFYQCHTNRLSGFHDILVSISADNTFGKKVVSPTVPIGTLEDHDGLKDTFHGSRMLRGTETVNQSISLSFDPANLLCLSCNVEHNVIGNKPMTMCFSDQNFVAGLPFSNGNCVGVA
jgi:hypothetical protein